MVKEIKLMIDLSIIVIPCLQQAGVRDDAFTLN
jgi:hypothetical protein